ncbi:MAG: CapA family protein [Chloroflexaceae bacterium]|nr:CapA family protein [Chloroflexaceae bacterium]
MKHGFFASTLINVATVGIGGMVMLLAAGAPFLTAPADQTAAAMPPRSENLGAPLMWANMCGAGAPGDVQFTFAATGDTFPHETIQAVAEAQGYDTLFEQVRPFLQAADEAYTNFDGAMLAGSPYTGYPVFNYNPELAAALSRAGIRVVSTANNHILDRGPEGLDATLEVLQSAGILHHGAVPTSASNQPRPTYLPLTLSRDGVSITIGFLSFTWGTNGIPDPYAQVNPLWQSNEYGQQGAIRQSVLDAIAQARRETDLVVVAAHWGYEYQFAPDPSQVEGAAQMAAAGADIILGAQSHTLQPVDVLDTGGRKTLVIYSLANFIADQAAFQATSFSDTSVIFYVGIIRQADGQVRVSGYRYLPTMMTDHTRPIPIPLQGFDDLHDHVRLMMRDFDGLFQVNPDPAALDEYLDVCPTLTFAGAPHHHIGGDFAQHVMTLGSGTTPHPLTEAIAVFGHPIGPVGQERSGDCQRLVPVLYTERQRLELHPEQPWPYRVMGTQIGTEVYRQKYPVNEVQRRLDGNGDEDGDAIANPLFRQFYQTYGGTTVFGYPISGELVETDPQTGQEQTVQYFERARFELVPGQSEQADKPLLDRVRLGLLSHEYAGIEAQCGLVSGPPTDGSGGAASPHSTAAGIFQRLDANGVRGWQNWVLAVGGLVVIAYTAHRARP